MKLLESGEMYLETIYVLSKNQQTVRSIDVANRTGYSKPSVSRAVNLLKDNGYISIDTDGHITLTASGLEVSNRIYERHTALTKLLCIMGVDNETAANDACKMEHVISDETFEKMKAFIENMQKKTSD